jgi:hypothetical protein
MNTLLSVGIATIGISAIGMGQGIGGHVGGLNRLADGLGDGVVDRGAGDLGDDMAVLDLNGDALHLGVVHTVLGGDLTASVLDGGNSGVGHSMSDRGNSMGHRGSSIAIVGPPVSLSIGLSLSLTLVEEVSSRQNGGNWRIAKDVHNILADLLVLNLLGGNGLGGAHILGRGCTGLSCEDLVLHLAVGSRKCMVGSGQEVLGIRLGRGGSLGCCRQTEDHKELKQQEKEQLDLTIEIYFWRQDCINFRGVD